MGLGYVPCTLPVNEDLSPGLYAWISFAAQRVPRSAVTPQPLLWDTTGRKELSKTTTDQEEGFSLLYTLVGVDEVFTYLFSFRFGPSFKYFKLKRRQNSKSDNNGSLLGGIPEGRSYSLGKSFVSLKGLISVLVTVLSL